MKELIATILQEQTKLKKEEIIKLIEIPPNPAMGDYSFPCFILSKPKTDEMWQSVEEDFFQKKNPSEIASHIIQNISKKLPKEIEKIDQKGPYINFVVNKEILAKQAIEIGKDFGKLNNKGKILLEHTSVNPNASPHVGRARNSIIGDSVKRILEFSGYKVQTHYYVNDVSKQVAMLALNFNKKDTFDDLLQRYVEISNKIKEDPELEKKVFELLHKFEHKDKDTTDLFKRIVDTAIEGQKKVFSSIGIEFDYFDYESRYIDEAKEILNDLEKTGKLFVDEENRKVLDQKGTNLDIKMKSPVLVLTRSDGTGLYVLRDLAYTIEKCKKGKNILVLGEDQKLYFEQLKHALSLLGKPSPEVVHYSFVLLKDLGKMSTRRGEVVLLEEFLKEAKEKAENSINQRNTKGDATKVAIGAVKYAMLKNENNKNIIFDWEQALNFEGDTGPYLQYSYARASSIIKKAKKSKSKEKIKIPLLTESETKLIKKILFFPDVVKQAEKNFSPSVIANYSFQLAQAFNEFYHACPVIGSKEEAFRLKLIESFRITLKSALYLLGIEVMEEM